MSLLVAELLVPSIVAFLLGLGVGWILWRWRQPKIVTTETRTVERIEFDDDVVGRGSSPPVPDHALRDRVGELEHELASVDAQVGELEKLIDLTRARHGLDPAAEVGGAE